MKISGTIRSEQYEWLKDRIGDGKYYNVSHAIQEGLKVLQDREEQKRLADFDLQSKVD